MPEIPLIPGSVPVPHFLTQETGVNYPLEETEQKNEEPEVNGCVKMTRWLKRLFARG